jgi:hypothetical protein
MKLIQQLILAFVLAVGFGVFCALIGNWTGEQVRHAMRRNDPVDRLLIKGDGTPVVTLSRPYLEPDARLQQPSADEVWIDTVFLAASERETLLGFFDDWHWRLRQVSDARYPGAVWYFVTDAQQHGTAYFAGYAPKTKELIGYLGAAGFRTDTVQASELFPFRGSERGSIFRLHSLNAVPWGQYAPIGVKAPADAEMPWRMFVQGDNDTIYLIDLVERSVSVAYRDRHIRSSAILLHSYPPAEAGRRDLVIRTEDAIVVINGRTNEQQRFTIPAELRDISFSWGQTTTGDQLAVWKTQMTPEAEIISYHVMLSDAAGVITRHNDGEVSEALPPNELRWFLGLNAPAPLLVDSIVGIWLPLRPWYGPHEPYGVALPRYVLEYWPSLVFVHVLSAMLAWLCYRRQSTNDANPTERVVWTLFVFLLGLPGWIGYRCTVAPRANEFAEPPMRGTEVFA